jgi:hypothetical protein
VCVWLLLLACVHAVEVIRQKERVRIVTGGRDTDTGMRTENARTAHRPVHSLECQGTAYRATRRDCGVHVAVSFVVVTTRWRRPTTTTTTTTEAAANNDDDNVEGFGGEGGRTKEHAQAQACQGAQGLEVALPRTAPLQHLHFLFCGLVAPVAQSPTPTPMHREGEVGPFRGPTPPNGHGRARARAWCASTRAALR